jgi:hypothetical protein
MEEEVKIQGNPDIDQALKEFEIKSDIEQVQKAPVNETISEVPKIVQLTMKWFGVKEQRQAEYVLLGFVIVAIVVSLVLLLRTKSDSKPAVPSITGIPIEKTFQE